jgi:hypothetical protein
MSIEVMKQALEFIDSVKVHPTQIATRDALHTALRAAIEQAEKQGPVAWMWNDGTITSDPDRADGTWSPLYTALRQWVGLTDEDIQQGKTESWVSEQAFESAVWWAEAKLKDKNAY